MNFLQKFLKKIGKGKHQPLYRSGIHMGYMELTDYVREVEPGTYTTTNEGTKESAQKSQRIVKKPAEIFQEIISPEPKVGLVNLDEQIKFVKERMQVLKDHLNKSTSDMTDERLALAYLEARKKYLKHKVDFPWAITTDKKIKELCEKYQVRLASIDGYYKCLPMEAIEEIKKFTQVFEKVSNIDPYFQLIIDDGGKETTKDPILLAESPFGRWYHILGAWDKEVEIVDDLIYKGK